MDRDGTVSEEVGYMYHAGLYKPFPWTGEAVRRINESGFKAILITNQSGVERGYFPESTVHEVHDVLDAELDRWSAISTESTTVRIVRKRNATAENQSRG